MYKVSTILCVLLSAFLFSCSEDDSPSDEVVTYDMNKESYRGYYQLTKFEATTSYDLNNDGIAHKDLLDEFSVYFDSRDFDMSIDTDDKLNIYSVPRTYVDDSDPANFYFQSFPLTASYNLFVENNRLIFDPSPNEMVFGNVETGEVMEYSPLDEMIVVHGELSIDTIDNPVYLKQHIVFPVYDFVSGDWVEAEAQLIYMYVQPIE